MELHELRPAKGAKKRRRRVGRGYSSGIGRTAGRGTKGQKARGTVPPGFEGGQMPLQRRVPKWGGFTPINRVEYAVVNVGKLEEAFDSGAVVDVDELRRRGIVRRRMPVKILGSGELTKSLTVRADAFSKTASEKISDAGGSVEVVS